MSFQILSPKYFGEESIYDSSLMVQRLDLAK